MIDAIVQFALAACGLTALYLATGSSARGRRWAPAFGLAAQPFWFFATWTAGQWGIFVLSLCYAAMWIRAGWLQWGLR